MRNPFFHEWSAAAQPAGYPDRISIRLLATHGASLVASGRADFIGGVTTIPTALQRSLLLHHPNLVRINPALSTNFLFLNVNVAPFDDLRARRALNLAIDRGAVVAARGGPLGGLPICQILPPGLPGYRRYCPYTRSPAPGRSWRGNDLKRARTLVAASGTAGMAVGVWDIAPSPESRAAVAALNLIGYHASLHLLPDKSFFTYTNDSRRHAQVITGGWSADYASPSNFIGKLTCAHFVPGNGNATTDASELCDPDLDERILHAATVEETAPADAAQLWAKLDRQLTDRAVWVPTVTPADLDLLSPRVTNYHYNPVWGALVDQFWLR